jgi:hypothetical protein
MTTVSRHLMKLIRTELPKHESILLKHEKPELKKITLTFVIKFS